MADEPTTPSPAPFNADALGGLIRDNVKSVLGDYAQQAQQQQVQQQQRQAAQQYATQARQDPIVSQVVEPYVAPAMRAMALQNQATLDAVHFYGAHPEAARYREEIERDFSQQMQTAVTQGGQPYGRETIYRHWIGANLDRYNQDRQQELQRSAAAGATLGAPGVGRAGQAPSLDATAARDMPLEDLERAVKGRMF